ncbi:glutamate 5-kinase [soil metagenome]
MPGEYAHRSSPRRVVVKVGSNVLALDEGGLNQARIKALCADVAAARANGVEVILVSSGAVAAGRGLLGLKRRPTDIPELQAVAAIGQGALMEAYNQHFRPHGILPAQVLLTRDDIDDRRRYLNARLALISLLNHRAVPIINENDTVTIDELKFGDNDMLSAMVAAKMDADMLIIMSNVAGLMTGHPQRDPSAKLIPVVAKITPEIESLVHAEGSEFGVGGMATKLLAARHATQFGVACVICDGRVDGQIVRVISGEYTGTLFSTEKRRKAGKSRRHWISSHRPKGDLVVDAGAEKALVESHRSLLPIGVKSVTGNFGKGDVVRIVSEGGADLARGIVNYDSAILTQIKGLKKSDVSQITGLDSYAEVIHANNLVLLLA